jgi:Endonuclease/Exonuclease/phosphatase family
VVEPLGLVVGADQAVTVALLRRWDSQPVVRQVHASGRWDRFERILRADIERWIADLRPDVVSLTEAGDRGRGQALERPGWQRVQHRPAVGADECALGFREAVLRLVDWESVPVSKATYKRVNGKRSPRFFALNVALQLVEDPDEVLVFSVLHTPSAVDSPAGWRKGPRAVVYRLVVWGWKRSANRFARSIRKDLKATRPKVRVHRVIAGDFNLHILRAWARKYLGTVFTKLAATWDRIKPNRGTLGARVIDYAFVSRSLRVLRARVLVLTRSSDHRTFWQDLAVLRRRKEKKP